MSSGQYRRREGFNPVQIKDGMIVRLNKNGTVRAVLGKYGEYGKNISIQKPQDYCDWLLPLFNEIHRVLKPSGSFILNINDTCKGGYRNPFIYELIYRSQKETKLKFYDTYIWHNYYSVAN